MHVTVVTGDLLDQKTEGIVNAWNMNVIPWWLLLPQGVSGAIKKKAGIEPFKELARKGRMRLGEAVPTGAGKLPYKAIIHVAGINMLWRATEDSIIDSVVNAVKAAERLRLKSLAFPILGSGSGGFPEAVAEDLMLGTMREIESSVEAVLVRYLP